MRNIVHASYEQGLVLATCDDGSLWLGAIRQIDDHSEPNDLIVEWKPLNGPPDGEPWFENKSMWDRFEERIRAQQQVHPDRK